MDVLTPEQRHKNMSHIRSKDTLPEVTLRKALWHLGIRYRKNYPLLPGKPDIVILRYRIAIFVDGDFWHGHNFKESADRIKTNHDYWKKKIYGNMMRDCEVNDLLTERGWIVLRFWASEIRTNLQKCVDSIFYYLP